MMKGTEGLIYEERLKKPKTQSQAPAMTSGNTITDGRHLKGVNHQREDVFSLVPKRQRWGWGEMKAPSHATTFQAVSRDGLEALWLETLSSRQHSAPHAEDSRRQNKKTHLQVRSCRSLEPFPLLPHGDRAHAQSGSRRSRDATISFSFPAWGAPLSWQV